MNFKQLKKQFLRDAKANPKKAGLLGLLVLVGCYFWLPLLMGNGEDPPARKPADTKRSTSSAAPAAAPAAEGEAVRQFEWRPLARWFDGHAWMQPAGPEIAAAESPFERAEPLPQEPEENPAEIVVVEPKESTGEMPDVSPEEAGLTLTSTLVGPKRRVAMVNGKIYIEGTEIVAGPDLAYRLLQVERGRVVLSRGGRQFELAIRQPGQLP